MFNWFDNLTKARMMELENAKIGSVVARRGAK